MLKLKPLQMIIKKVLAMLTDWQSYPNEAQT